jgi:hypothetical protein
MGAMRHSPGAKIALTVGLLWLWLLYDFSMLELARAPQPTRINRLLIATPDEAKDIP